MRTTSNTCAQARRLRRSLTLPEVPLWQGLRTARRLGAPTRRQHPFGPYILDFYCPSARLCIEVDGAAHGFGDQPARDAFLRRSGVRILRLTAAQVLADPAGNIDAVLRMVTQREPSAPSTPSGSPSPIPMAEDP